MTTYYLIPAHMREALDAYAQHKRPVGGFLTALLENNLMEAVVRADHANRLALPSYAAYIRNEMPHNCHGSPAIVAAWLASSPLPVQDAYEQTDSFGKGEQS